MVIGDYETASEVVREGLRLLKQRDEVWKAAVRDKVRQGMDSIRAGRSIPAEQRNLQETNAVAMSFISGMPGFCLSRRFH